MSPAAVCIPTRCSPGSPATMRSGTVASPIQRERCAGSRGVSSSHATPCGAAAWVAAIPPGYCDGSSHCMKNGSHPSTNDRDNPAARHVSNTPSERRRDRASGRNPRAVATASRSSVRRDHRTSASPPAIWRSNAAPYSFPRASSSSTTPSNSTYALPSGTMRSPYRDWDDTRRLAPSIRVPRSFVLLHRGRGHRK